MIHRPCSLLHAWQCGKSLCGVPGGTVLVTGWWSPIQFPLLVPGDGAPHEWHPRLLPIRLSASRSAWVILPGLLDGTDSFAQGPGFKRSSPLAGAPLAAGVGGEGALRSCAAVGWDCRDDVSARGTTTVVVDVVGES